MNDKVICINATPTRCKQCERVALNQPTIFEGSHYTKVGVKANGFVYLKEIQSPSECNVCCLHCGTYWTVGQWSFCPKRFKDIEFIIIEESIPAELEQALTTPIKETVK